MSKVSDKEKQDQLSLVKEGVSLPFRLLAATQAQMLVEKVIPELESQAPAYGTNALTARHLDHEQIYRIATCAPILDQLAPMLGDKIVLWQSNFFIKDAAEARVPWHQDAYHWPLQPKVAVSAWLALTPVTEDNGCIKLVPGIKDKLFPTRRVADPCHRLFREEAVLKEAQLNQAKNMLLDSGEAFLFDSFIPHASLVNESGEKRIGLALRYTREDVSVGVEHPLILLEKKSSVWVETERRQAGIVQQ